MNNEHDEVIWGEVGVGRDFYMRHMARLTGLPDPLAREEARVNECFFSQMTSPNWNPNAQANDGPNRAKRREEARAARGKGRPRMVLKPRRPEPAPETEPEPGCFLCGAPTERVDGIDICTAGCLDEE